MAGDMQTRTGPLSGRKAQAARNDQTILDAARTVFMRDPSAPISDVARQAGVGVSALYRRYASKDELLQKLCADGLHRFIAVAEAAVVDQRDAWDVFAAFVRGIIDADVHSLTVHLAGTFPPTEELHRLVEEANKRAARIFRRAKAAGAIRADLHLNDLAMLFEQLTAVRVDDPERTRMLRQRYLELQLDGLRPEAARTTLTGPAPSSEELRERWIPPLSVSGALRDPECNQAGYLRGGLFLVGAAFAPVLAAIGAIAALVNECTYWSRITDRRFSKA
jgi:AcrR family transcriptional regulator